MRRSYGAVCLAGALGLAACAGNAESWEKPETLTLGCEAYQSILIEDAVLYNNVWNSHAAEDGTWQQCLEQKPQSDPAIHGWSWQWPRHGREVYSQPQIKIGSSPWEPLPRTDMRFPVKLGTVESLQITHQTDIDAVGDYNVVTTLWLTNTDNIGTVQNPDIITAEIMFWTYASSSRMVPGGRKMGEITVDD